MPTEFLEQFINRIALDKHCTKNEEILNGKLSGSTH